MKRVRPQKHGVSRPTTRAMQGASRTPGRVTLLDLAFDEESRSRWPSISACMIVKNEAANLRPCLESLGDLASEIVVVDTGSTDNTVQIAQEMGARVFDFPWIDDFAAARNESLRHATKDWIFWLDADDRLDPKAVAQLKSAAASGRADAFMCIVHSKKASGSEDVIDHVRLFQNGLGIRFTGAIHETAFPDMVRLGLRLANTNISLDHLGYESTEVSKRKTARNLVIIEREVATAPDRLDLLFYRGQARRGVGDLGGAEADLRTYLSRTKPDVRFDWTRFWAYSALAYTLDDLQRLQEAEQLLEKAIDEFPRHSGFLLHLGRLHLARGKALQAVGDFKAALESLSEPVLGLRPAQVLIEMGLAEAYSGAGSKEEAAQWADQVRAHAPTSYQAAELSARLYVEAGQTTKAEALLAQMAASVNLPAPWLLLADLRQKQGQWEAAASAVLEAKQRGLADHEANELLTKIRASRLMAETRTKEDLGARQSQAQMSGLALLAQGEHLKAAESFAQAVQEAPSNPDNYKYLAVALRALGQERQAMEAWQLAARYAAQP